MNISSIRHLTLLLAAALISGCSPIHIYMPSQHEPDKTFNTIIQESLSELTGISTYSDSIQTNDSFLITALPGIPLNKSDLAFSSLSGVNLTGDLQAVDQAYRFAKLVNQAVISSSSYEPTGIELSNLYPCLLKQLSPEIISESEFNDLKLIKITSPTFNDDFYLTSIIPAGEILTKWVDYEQTISRQDMILSDGETTTLLSQAVPSHRFKASLLRLDLQRHSMLDKLIYNSRNNGENINKCIPQMTRSISVITGLILAKEIVVDKFASSNDPVIISNTTSNLKSAEPITSMRSKGPLIIGIIAKQL